jgi:putative hydrolase of HD superfamily
VTERAAHLGTVAARQGGVYDVHARGDALDLYHVGQLSPQGVAELEKAIRAYWRFLATDRVLALIDAQDPRIPAIRQDLARFRDGNGNPVVLEYCDWEDITRRLAGLATAGPGYDDLMAFAAEVYGPGNDPAAGDDRWLLLTEDSRMIAQLDRPCWTASPIRRASGHYADEAQALDAAGPLRAAALLATAVLASPCWTAACDHPGCDAVFREESDPGSAVTVHMPDETTLRACLAGGGWAYGSDGRAWCVRHRADKGTLEAALLVTQYAATFACVERAVVTPPDDTAETDSDHTVHLAWLAPALAAATEPGLDPVLVAAYAVVHDAVEVFAGDTPTITITPAERARKQRREEGARWYWHDGLDAQLPWLPVMIDRYESQADPEARFVKAADKIAPKLKHYLSCASDLHAAGVTPGQFRDMTRQQRAALDGYAKEFPALLGLYEQVTARVCQCLDERAGDSSKAGS